MVRHKKTKGYMVLSISELKMIMKDAERQSRGRYEGRIEGKSTIVLNLEISNKKSLISSNGRKQVGLERY